MRLGDLAVRFDFKPQKDGTYNREGPLLMGLMTPLPRHKLAGQDGAKIPFNHLPVSGPYTIGQVDMGKSITYHRRPDFWGWNLPTVRGYYAFDRVVMDYYRDRQVAEEAFRVGLIDVWTEDDSRHMDHLRRGMGANRVTFSTIQTSGPVGMTALAFNLRRSQFQDRRVRLALNLAFDAPTTKALFFGDDFCRTTSFFDNTIFKSPTADRYVCAPGDRRAALKQARDLLRDAGWVIRRGRLCHHKTGAPFSLEILLYEKRHEKMVLALGRDLKPLGIQVTCRLVDSTQYMDRLTHFDFDMIVHFWGHGSSPGIEQRNYWSSKMAEVGGINYMGIRDAAIDACCDRVMGASDRPSLVRAIQALDGALLSGYYVIPLFHNPKKYLAYWPKFGHPDMERLGYVEMTSWWSIPPIQKEKAS